MKIRKIHILAAALCLALFCGCTEVDETLPEPAETTVTEAQPYPVTIGSLVFNSSPETAASLSPAITEMICELGFESKLKGKSVYCDYPKSVASLASLGSAANPDVDAIIRTKPMLLLSQSPIAKKDITAIENAGTRVLIISAPDSVTALQELYRSIYRVFSGETDNETDIIAEKFEPLQKSLDKNKNLLGSYVFILAPDLSAASDSTFAGNFFSHMGKNAAAENSSNTVTAEELLAADPQYIILPPTMKKSDLPEEISGLSAIEENRVITLDEETAALLERPTSRIYLVSEYIAEKVKNPVSDEPEEDKENEDENQ